MADGYLNVAGIDEAGRGPLAGPVSASAVIIKDRVFTARIDDSKRLTAKNRERAFVEIIEKCDVGIGTASVEEIDKLNIYNATLLAMKRAIGDLNTRPDFLLIDGNMKMPGGFPQLALVSGETYSFSIACASIIAKVYRDRIMMDEDGKYPEYGFKNHKGYGTKEHLENIRKHGLSHIHRKTFGPFGSHRT